MLVVGSAVAFAKLFQTEPRLLHALTIIELDYMDGVIILHLVLVVVVALAVVVVLVVVAVFVVVGVSGLAVVAVVVRGAVIEWQPPFRDDLD